ncbi:MAG: L,D-transpeptidase/peptidoglycan binding protein, partial [Frankia sp.]|nr:L,D-transpeptidase/peptidoglycan binding protein [Frankia sp.]
VRTVVEHDFDRPASVTVAGRTYTVTLRGLGVRTDPAAAVDAAFAAATRGSWLTRAWARLFGGYSAPKVNVDITEPDAVRLGALVRSIAADDTVAPLNASVTPRAGFLAFAHSRVGWRLDERAATTAFREALKDGVPRTVNLTRVDPTVSDAAYDTVLLVRTGENKLYIYKQGHVARVFGVATGSPKYPTPKGRFQVTLKRYLPTWYNPHSEWSKDEPETIPPGPKNPLGTRAMNLSAPGIRIHGTPAARSIGYSVSHGCIRMRMPDVEALYPMVPKGTTVFIVTAGPPRLPGMRVVTGAANAADGG